MFTKQSLFGRPTPAHSDSAPSVPATSASPSSSAPNVNVTAPRSPLMTAKRPATSSPLPAYPPSNADRRQPAVEVILPAEKPQSSTIEEARLVVGRNVKLKGAEILDCDTLVVEGRVEATMDSRVIRISEHGAFVGKVSIDIAEIHGTFEGELTARSQLIIHATGKVSGTIRYGKLLADEGCELCGDINRLPSVDGQSPRQRVPYTDSHATEPLPA